MKSVQSHPSAALLGVANKPPLTWELPQPKRPIALKVATALDGKGGTLRDTVVVVSGDKIERIGGPVPQGAQVYDLGGLTVAPGLIDTHVHVTYHFSHDRFIDNRLVGTTPVSVAEVAAGEHTVRLELAGYRQWTSPARVAAGETRRITASLEK